jgi:hypothetical protein
VGEGKGEQVVAMEKPSRRKRLRQGSQIRVVINVKEELMMMLK